MNKDRFEEDIMMKNAVSKKLAQIVRKVANDDASGRIVSRYGIGQPKMPVLPKKK